MGSNLSREKKVRVLMLGTHHSGKTVLLYRIKEGVVVETIPTIGFNVEDFERDGIIYYVWDVRGSCFEYSNMHHHYYQDTNAIIYVINVHDRDSFRQVEFELDQLFKEQVHLLNAPILIFSNKQDLNVANADYQPLSTIDLIERFDIHTMNIHSKKWHIQPCSVLTNEGIEKGLQWLSSMLKNGL